MAPRCYLLDIEGTTTPIDFVFKTLFPFARTEVGSYLERSHASAEVGSAITILAAEYEADGRPVLWPGYPDSVGATAYIHWQMDRDRKSRGLKSLQGWIWEEGYRSGRLRGEVYPDVVPAIRKWKASGATVCIYSSGSVLAQRLLFASLPEGDITPMLDGFYDTEVGPKREASSYRAIAQRRAIPAEEILFLSDIVEEVQAAREAGMGATQVLREGKVAETSPSITGFEAIPF